MLLCSGAYHLLVCLSSSQRPIILSSLTVHRKLPSLMGHPHPLQFSLLYSLIVGMWRPVLG